MATEAEFWTSSARFSTGVTDDVTEEEAEALLKLRPSVPRPAIRFAVFNTHLEWSSGAGQRGHIRATNGRADNLVNEVKGRGCQFGAPEPCQWDPVELGRGAGRLTGQQWHTTHDQPSA